MNKMNNYEELKEHYEKLGEWITYRKKIEGTLRVLSGKSVSIKKHEYIDGINCGGEEYLNSRLINVVIKAIKEELYLFDITSFEDWSKENE